MEMMVVEDKKIVEEIYTKKYEELSKKYPFTKPFFKAITIQSSYKGSFNPYGFKYSKCQPVIKINLNRTLYEIEKTIIHEFCHAIDYSITGKTGHNPKFWKLCYQFGLNEKDYSYGLTRTMERAKKELNM